MSTFKEAIDYYEENEPKGECVLVIEGISVKEVEEEKAKEWEQLTLKEHVELYMKQDMSKKEAMKQVALDRGMKKRDVYQALLEE